MFFLFTAPSSPASLGVRSCSLSRKRQQADTKAHTWGPKMSMAKDAWDWDTSHLGF